MINTIQSAGFQVLDIVAIVIFIVAWVSHYWIINYSPWRHKTISAQMAAFRMRWMRNMAYRDPKMPDTLLQNTLQYGVLFFASTSILIIGALMAGLGASDRAIETLSDLPFAVQTSRTAWELKVLLVTTIFTFAFFKFAWSYRLFNYVLIIIGAAPDQSVDQNHAAPNSFDRENYAEQTGVLHTLAAKHFTMGLNSYFFALAACTWFLNPVVFIFTTIWVSIVMYRRAFFSVFSKTLSKIDGI